MRRLRALLIRLRGLLARRRNDDDFEAELDSHIAMHTDDGIRAGLTPKEARRQALVYLAGAEQTRQAHRERQMLPGMEALFMDVRYGFRSLRRSPGFASVAILSLALGIGATAAMYSLIYAVLLHPFPYDGADRIMNPLLVDQKHPEDQIYFDLSKPELDEISRQPLVEQAMGFNASHMEITGGPLPEEITGIYLTENAGVFLGVRPLLGRNLQPSDAEGGGRTVVVLNYRFWQRYYLADPHIIGQTLRIDHTPYTVIGVMPKSFAFNDTTGVGDVYLPGSLMATLPNLPDLSYVPWIRLRPGVTPVAANTALEPVIRQHFNARPERFPENLHLGLEPIIVPYRHAAGRPLILLLIGTVVLLVIGCTNCSILLLARGQSRQREVVIRRAIGATRWRLVRQSLIEALAIAAFGGVLGVAASYWLARLPLYLAPDSFPAESVIRVNGPVLIFSVTLAILAGLLSGLIPALRLSRDDSAGTLPGARQIGASAPVRRRWSFLVATQVTLTLLLLATAGSSIQSFLGLMSMRLGYDAHDILKVGLMLHVHADSWKRIQPRQARTAYIEQLRQKVAAIPGVLATAAATDGMPATGGSDRPFELDRTGDRAGLQARVLLVDQQYFSTLHIPVLQGRVWNADENNRGDFVALVNRAFVLRYLPSSDLARQLRLPGLTFHNTYAVTSDQSTAWRRIIGVVGDIRNDGLDSPVVPAIYLPYTSLMAPAAQLFLSTHGDPLQYLPSIRTAIASVAPDQEISHGTFNGTMTLEEALEHDPQYSRQQLFSILFGVFSAMALALALIGIVSVVSYSVAQRTTEFGVRLSLGASRTHVLWVAARAAMLSATVGVATGLSLYALLGAVLSRWMENTFAPASLAGAAVLLALGALLACLVPARHATTVPPAEALRAE